MCGRFNITSDPLAKLLVSLVNMPYAGEDNFNAAPTEQIPVVRIAPDGADNAGAPELVPMRWWLTPYWAKEMSSRYAMFNAKSETAAKSPAFREPFKKRRCVVPVTGFYEWCRQGDVKQPYMITSRDSEGLLIAGLWDRWRNKESGEVVLSFTVLTTAANERLEFVHKRQPVMLSVEDARRWLDPDIPTDDLDALFASAIPEPLDVIPVSTLVNNARNKGAEVADPTGAPIQVDPAMMLLRPGHWLGKGSVLLQGMSLGQPVNVDVRVEEHDDGITVSGVLTLGDQEKTEISIRIVPNEVGTYTVDAFVAGTKLDGVGKLESDPHVALLWHERDLAHVSAALFPVARGFGCRGFLRERDTVRTWEIAFSLKQETIGGGNVVSLSRRRRR